MLYIKAIIIILLSPTWNLSRTCPELILGISKIRFFFQKKECEALKMKKIIWAFVVGLNLKRIFTTFYVPKKSPFKKTVFANISSPKDYF